MIINHLRNTKKEINNYVPKILQSKLGDYPILVSLIKYSFNGLGSNLRASLFKIGLQLQSLDFKDYFYGGIGLEFLQNSTLVLDDIIDSSKLRNGKESLHKKYGVELAICTGAFMSNFSTELINELEVPPQKRCELLYLLTDSKSAIYKGQVDDYLSDNENYLADNYLKTIKNTTAKFISNSLLLGYTCGEDLRHYEALKNYGLNLGIAFQVRDDLLDFIAVKGTGKEVGVDLKVKRRRLPLIFLLDKLSSKERDIFNEIWKKEKLSNENISNIINLLLKYEIDNDCLEVIKSYSNKALTNVETLPESLEKELLCEAVELISEI